jgi:sugar phosphate isomerase/epimerase
MKIRTGLNPYGLSYYLGLMGMGTPRANPSGAGLDGFIELAVELEAKVIELPEVWLSPMSGAELGVLKARLDELDLTPVMSSGLQHCDFDFLVKTARALDAKLIRLALTPILCGDRAAAGEKWLELVASVRERLTRYAPIAAENGLLIVIENHQDFTSGELVGFCQEFGDSVRIVYDTGNCFPVAEAPLDFTETVAPYVRYVHLKDYRIQWTDEGIRLVRCAIGDGAIPFPDVFNVLGHYSDAMTCVLEPGALEARHVRLFTDGWWTGYPAKSAKGLAACLLAARRNRLGDDADWRTPWERGEYDAIADYELGMIRRSATNMKKLGLM